MNTRNQYVVLLVILTLICGLSVTQTSVIAEEVTNQELFKQLDQNRDGVLTKSDVNESQLIYFERLLRKSDQNKDGKLTITEMNSGLKEPEASANLEVATGPGGGRGEMNPEQMFQFMDRNQDGKLQRNELPEMAKERLGKLYDFLGKEELTKEEYSQIIGRMQGPGMPGQMPKPDPEQLVNMLERMDQNNDGKVSPVEIPERASPMITQLRQRLGFKENDSINIKEIKDKLAARAELSPSGEMNSTMEKDKNEKKSSEMKRDEGSKPNNNDNPRNKPDASNTGNNKEGMLFKQMDKNGDGSISRNEAPERMRQFFDRIDQNKDGKLSSDELSRAREQRENK